MNNEINDVYLKLDSIFKLKLKSQIKGSGLSFSRLLHVTDLVKEKTHYILFVNSDGIYFNDLPELYSGLIKVVQKELVKIENETNSYQSHLRNDLKCDEAFIYSELDGLGYQESKLCKVLEMIKKNLENQNK